VLPLLGLVLTPSLFSQTTYQLNAYSRNGDTLATNSILDKAGVTRTPAGTAVSGDGLITSHPAGASIKVTAPISLRLGLPLTFHGWAPTAYNAVTGYAAADTTNPLTFPLTADRKLVGFSGFPFADVLTTPGRVWATGGHALWTGTYDVFSPAGGGSARAAALENVGDEAWLESTFTAPVIIGYTWRLDIASGSGARLEALIDGVVSDTLSVDTVPSWKPRSLDLTGTGPVKVRFRLTHTATSTIPSLVNLRPNAYLATILTGTFTAPTRVIVSSTTASAATLSWDAAYGAASYTAELASDAAFTQVLFTQNITAPAVTHTFGGLTPGALYHYRVISRRAGYDPLISAAGSFIAVVRAAQTITFPAIPNATLGTAPFSPGATASSTLPITYSVVSGNAVITEAGLLMPTGVGTAVIRAEQRGNHAFEPAPSVNQFVSLRAPTSATVKLTATTRIYNGSAHTVTATTTPANLPVTYSYKLGTAAASTTPPTAAGSYAVTATVTIPGLTVAPAKSTLIINKAPLSVIGLPAQRAVAQVNPALTLSYSGFVGDDDQSDIDAFPTPTTTADLTSAQGTYPIGFKGGLDNNYSFVPGFPAGLLTVIGFGGNYDALVFDDEFRVLGKLTLTIPKNSLAYTGALTLDSEAKTMPLPTGRRLQPASHLNSASDITLINLPAITGGRPARSYRLSFEVNIAGYLESELELDSTPFASCEGRMNYVAPARTTAPWKGLYTLTFGRASTGSHLDVLPLGTGHATATIDAAGKLSLTGKLSDGTALTAAAQADLDGIYRVFVKPHGTRVGQGLGGMLMLSPHPDYPPAPAPTARYRANNVWDWSKSGLGQDKSYRAGIGPAISFVDLEPWLPPAARIAPRGTTPEVPAITLAQRLRLTTSPTADAPFALEFDDANFTLTQLNALPTSLSMKSTGAVIYSVPNATAFKITFTATTGAFAGDFIVAQPIVPPATKAIIRKATFTGVLSQPPIGGTDIIGSGHFLLPALPGAPSTEQTSGLIRLRVPGGS
jgi:hypothetical protein